MTDYCQSAEPNAVAPGFYRGVVLKHLRNGMCKIWIPGVYSAELSSYDKADSLPDAEQASPLVFGANKGLGIFSYPSISSVVWCFFENNDQNYPVYFASTLGGSKAYDDGEGKSSDDGWQSALNMPGMHPDDAFLHHIAVKDSDIKIYETGRIVVTASSGGKPESTIDIDSRGNVSIDSDMKIVLHSKNIQLSSDTQIDMNAPNIKIESTIQTVLHSPAINLSADTGHVRAVGRTGGKTVV